MNARRKLLISILLGANSILMILPLIAVYFIDKDIDIYELRTVLTEKTYIFIFIMLGINVAVFILNKMERINFLLKVGFVVETFIGGFLYFTFYDYILTY